MKTLSIIFLFFAFYFNAFGQDKIYLRSKEVLNVNVMEVWPNYIFYTLPSDTSKKIGIKKRKIEKIAYKNGTFYNIKLIDTSHYLKFGIIPYQVFGRSSGWYIGYRNKRVTFEYRYFYSYATNYYPAHSDNFAKFFFAGDNHNLVISLASKDKNSIGIIAGYKSWWFSDKYVPLYDIYSFRYSSSHVQGFCFGLEYSKDLSKKWFNAEFFMDLSYSHLSGQYEIIGYNKYVIGDQKYSKSYDFVHLAIGFKLGGRIKLPKSKAN